MTNFEWLKRQDTQVDTPNWSRLFETFKEMAERIEELETKLAEGRPW
jgi:hypothetical protein